MPQFQITIPNIDQFTAAFKNAPSIVAPYLQSALNASMNIIARNTTQGNVPWRTGQLVRSFLAGGSGMMRTWGPSISYAPFVEFGTAPHNIYPKDKLALFWPGAAHPVKMVHHPGSKANDYMGRIVDKSQDDITAVFGQALQQITQAIAAQAS